MMEGKVKWVHLFSLTDKHFYLYSVHHFDSQFSTVNSAAAVKRIAMNDSVFCTTTVLRLHFCILKFPFPLKCLISLSFLCIFGFVSFC